MDLNLKVNRQGASVSQRRTTELGDTVTTTLTIKEGRLHQDIVIEGPGELQSMQRREGAGKVWPGGEYEAGAPATAAPEGGR